MVDWPRRALLKAAPRTQPQEQGPPKTQARGDARGPGTGRQKKHRRKIEPAALAFARSSSKEPSLLLIFCLLTHTQTQKGLGIENKPKTKFFLIIVGIISFNDIDARSLHSTPFPCVFQKSTTVFQNFQLNNRKCR